MIKYIYFYVILINILALEIDIIKILNHIGG